MRENRLLSSAALPWIAFLAVALAPLVMSSSWTNMAILTLLFIHLCIAWNLVGGIAGQFCIGHSLFLAAGAYTSTLLSIHLGITPWIGMFAGAALAAVIGVFIAWLSFRYELPPLSFALVTIALAMLGAVLDSPRYTDYAGAAQAVMAADTLISALTSSGQIARGDARAMRGYLDRAYAQVRDPNGFKPADFRQSFARLSAV